jgi:uncharacterized membrane protein
VATQTPPGRILGGIAFFALSYLLAASLLSRLIRLPTLGDIGFTLVFTGFSVLHAGASLGQARTALFFGVTAVVSGLLEYAGVSTGAPFGAYHYGSGLGLKVGGVPLLIPLAWFMMIYPSWQVAGALLGQVRGGPFLSLALRGWVAAMVMTMWDTVMDPAMAARGAWIWEQGGPYFGVPFENYVGWLVTTFTVYVVAALLMRAVRSPAPEPGSRAFRAQPIVIYALMACTYLMPRRQASLEPLRLVAGFTMGFAALLALFRQTLGIGPGSAGEAG